MRERNSIFTDSRRIHVEYGKWEYHTGMGMVPNPNPVGADMPS